MLLSFVNLCLIIAIVLIPIGFAWLDGERGKRAREREREREREGRREDSVKRGEVEERREQKKGNEERKREA